MLRSSFLIPDVLRQLSDVAPPASNIASHTLLEPERTQAGSRVPKPKNRVFWINFGKKFHRDSRPILDTTPPSFPYPTFTYLKRLSGDFGKHTIRLLRVLPGKLDDSISCELQYVSLVDDTQYEAISYCWGEQVPTVEIACNGNPLRVTENLAAAIRTFRRKDSTILLWADAICINQEDVNEKNCQVPLMRRIYERASAVRVWLGQDTETKPCEKAFGLLETLKSACLNLGWSFNVTQLAADPTVLSVNNIPDIDDPSWRVIGQLIEKPWFGRAWIIQEIVVSREAYLHCGSTILRWMDFYTGFLVGMNSGLFLMRPDAFPNSLAYQQVIQLIMIYYCFNNRQVPAFDLPALLENHRLVGATDPKDKIYALLGLSEMVEDQKHDVVPDYDSPAADVYIAVAKVILERNSTLDLLSVSKVSLTPNVGPLPSWVPDWSTWNFANSLCFRNIHGKHHFTFDAARTSQVPKHLSIRDNTLELNGQVFDRISKAGRVMDPFLANRGPDLLQFKISTFAFHGLAVLNDWAEIAGFRGRRTYPTGEDIADVYARTLYLNDFSNGYTMEGTRDFWNTFFYRASETAMTVMEGTVIQKFLIWTESKGFLLGRMSLSTNSNNKKRSGGSIKDLLSRIIQRKLILTNKGYIGIVPRLAEEGDFIVSVKGGRVPLILRPKDDQWELLGDCYVHGIMHGEAFEESKCNVIRII